MSIVFKSFLFFCLCFIATLSLAKPMSAESIAEKPTVVIITTGGTIASTANKLGHVVPTSSGQDLIKKIPELKRIAHIKVIDFLSIDSSQMLPANWVQLSKEVRQVLADKNVRGVVVTHGTDTIAEAAFFLDLTLSTNKPVVLTGAMRSFSDVSYDGSANILYAVEQVVAAESYHWGVTVSMNELIQSPRYVRKVWSHNVQAFDSGPKGYLGYMAHGKVIKINERMLHHVLPIAKKLPRVVYLITYAGDSGNLLRYAVDSGAQGIVVDAMGAGNVGEKMYRAINYALRKKIPVVITTRVYYGGALPIYGGLGGGAQLFKKGAILAHRLTGPKARLLLMLVIPQAHGKMSQVRGYFNMYDA